ncbi:endolytic transglycosylase MltG [Microbacterium sp. C7(2022)]|uniref:endolytic transglycosylase MltG n=1 Tax=Microbacterium sp. C7(2022) TaxID=2992759 RepID=UPI00237AE06F|nr:endolytic transglycosylase MltG [Microbacterium sp. C7(2022)]MDE0545538.1 endolytic transglycosylase MltG [Microbacterium sp. C7(2022)]
MPARPSDAPMSRREARAAAQGASAAPTDSVTSSAPEARQVSAASSADRAQPETQPFSVEDQWLFAGASGATAASYRRGGTAHVSETVAPGGARTATPTLEDLFSGETTTDALGAPPPPTDKRKRRIGGWIALGVVLVIFGGIAAGGLWVWNTYEDQIREVMGWEEPNDYEDGLATGEAFVTVDAGDTGSPISQKLYEAGVTMTPEAFYDYLIDNALNPNFQPGVYRMQQQMSSAAALAAIEDPANKMENSAQLREGLTVDQSLPILAEGIGIELADFEAAVSDPSAYGVDADSLEGWLFPATYTFDPGVTAEQVIGTLVNRTVQSLDAAGVPEDRRQEILTIASIIEREARYEEDMQKVSTVIQNRLKPDNQETFGLLQMDSTAQYGYGEMHDGTVSSSQEALEDDNPWNTYVHTGLPVGPIANPGDVAIDSAMHPADGDWMYFVTVNLDTGETVFTTNLADHNRAVSQWQSWCADNPDSGC